MIYEAIASCGQMNCSQIASLQGVTPATVSHHLKPSPTPASSNNVIVIRYADDPAAKANSSTTKPCLQPWTTTSAPFRNSWARERENANSVRVSPAIHLIQQSEFTESRFDEIRFNEIKQNTMQPRIDGCKVVSGGRQ